MEAPAGAAAGTVAVASREAATIAASQGATSTGTSVPSSSSGGSPVDDAGLSPPPSQTAEAGTVAGGTVAPPKATCPSTPPTNGSPCSDPTLDPALQCQYGDDPNFACDTVAFCQQQGQGQTWTVSTVTTGGVCPTSLPGARAPIRLVGRRARERTPAGPRVPTRKASALAGPWTGSLRTLGCARARARIVRSPALPSEHRAPATTSLATTAYARTAHWRRSSAARAFGSRR